MKNIIDTDICCPSRLVENIINVVQNLDEYVCIELYAHADVISEVLRILMCAEVDGKNFTLGMINFDSGYDYVGEFTLSINDMNEIWIEPTWRESNNEQKLCFSDADIAFVDKFCDNDIIDNLINCKVDIALFES